MKETKPQNSDDPSQRPSGDRLEEDATQPGALPVAPGLGDIVDQSEEAEEKEEPRLLTPKDSILVDKRTVLVSGLAILVAAGAGLLAQVLILLIRLFTNIAFFWRFSTAFSSPTSSHVGWILLLIIPVVGGLIVGVIARFGSASIRGHGIPEVMEKVLFGESRIRARLMILKPLSAAIAIGTGGPFGAEGPIIATGGALGSIIGQILHVTADERKTLLAAGAAAGMAATFGTPVSAVLLAVELLLFEYHPRSLIPVALAAVTATAVHVAFAGGAPVFAVPDIAAPRDAALISYVFLGALMGAIGVGITRVAYLIEDGFEILGHRFHIHWMWWPAIGALAVGLCGILEPRTLGIGYANITGALGGTIVGRALFFLVLLKFISWAFYISSGTSGGTLAPLFTIGSGLGAWIGQVLSSSAPALGVSPGVAALVGMAALFAGATHALLTSIVFAFETTRQPLGLLPLLGGCSAAYLVSLLLSRESLMTEKLVRRGIRLRNAYTVDHLSNVLVRDAAEKEVVALTASDTLSEVRAWLEGGAGGATHQGFPVLDGDRRLVGVVTRRDLLDKSKSDTDLVESLIRRPPAVVFDDSSLREAADHMVVQQVGRLPVVTRDEPRIVIGMISRSDLLSAHSPRLRAKHHLHRSSLASTFIRKF
jgi:H+/Cl- antiporter ClcA/CBS domain-containing protein